MKVSNLTSERSGGAVPNQFEIYHKGVWYLQSYRTIVAKRDKAGQVWLDPKWEYSRTTMKYVNQWLGGYTAKEIRARIKEGEYKVTNLN